MILVEGSVAPALIALMAGSSQLVILPRKILVITVGVRVRSLTPFTLYATAIGPVTIGRSRAGEPHAAVALATSSLAGSRAESEPAKSSCLAMKLETPAPEPVPL